MRTVSPPSPVGYGRRCAHRVRQFLAEQIPTGNSDGTSIGTRPKIRLTESCGRRTESREGRRAPLKGKQLHIAAHTSNATLQLSDDESEALGEALLDFSVPCLAGHSLLVQWGDRESPAAPGSALGTTHSPPGIPPCGPRTTATPRNRGRNRTEDRRHHSQ